MSVTGYTALTFTAGEMPTTAKWNLLPSNDAAFNTSLSGPGTVPTTVLTNPYRFSVYCSTSPTLTANVALKVPFDTDELTPASTFDRVTNYRFTAPVAGQYFVSASVRVGSAGITGTAYVVATLNKNGTGFKNGQQIAGSGTGATLPTSQISTLVQMLAGDYLEVIALTSDGGRGIFAGQGNTYFSGFLVSAT